MLSYKKQHVSRVIVRVITNTFFTNTGIKYEKVVRVLKRKSKGSLYDFIQEPNEITNLLDVEDGLYHVTAQNISYDYETGYPDDWDVVLVPYKEEPNNE